MSKKVNCLKNANNIKREFLQQGFQNAGEIMQVFLKCRSFFVYNIFHFTVVFCGNEVVFTLHDHNLLVLKEMTVDDI